MRKRILFLGIVVLLFASLGASNSVGIVPGSIDFGEIEAGETIEQDVFVRTSGFSSEYQIHPRVSNMRKSMLFSSSFEGYNEVSEQSHSDWFNIESVTVDPSTDIDNSEVPMTNPPRVDGRFTVGLNVPSDAEPGYRRGRIRLNPDIEADGDGAGALTIGETRMSYEFNVPGEVERDINVQDVRGFRLGEDEASVELLLTNRGTVTTSTERFEVDILDQSGSSSATLRASGTILEPGESEWTNALWTGESVDEGTYQIDGELDYLTGSAYASGSFSLSDIVEVVPEDSPTVEDEESERATVPLWLVFMVLALLGVLMWSFDIDPFWILAIVGGLAVAAFILLSGVSNYLLVVLLMTVGIVVYGVM